MSDRPSITRVVKYIRKGVGVARTEVEYADSTSNSNAPTSGWQTNAPAWKNGHYIWQRVKFIYTDDSYSYSNAVCLSGGKGISKITEYYLATASSSGVTTSTSGWTTSIQTVTATKKYLWNYEVVTYTDGSTTTTTPVIIGTYGDKGDRGDRGPGIRGPQAWSDCAVGYKFQSGGSGDEYKDVVLYNGNYYSCIKNHTKTASNYPTSTTDTNNGYWKLGDKVELIASNILLATYALVKNLGVEAIDMKDSNGNVLFRAKDGVVTCKTGNFDNVNIQSGKIAGFEISGNGLTNDPFTNDAYVIFRNDTHNCFAGIGGNVLPASSGQRAVARFENEDNNDWWGLGHNIALLLSAKNSDYNHAFIGTGNGTLNGWIDGYKYSKFSCTTANTIYTGAINLKTNNRWLVYSSVSSSGVVLPTLSDVRNALYIGTSTPFCVKVTIIADFNTTTFAVYGRNNIKDSSGKYPWNTTTLPVLTHWNGGRWDKRDMAQGDSLTLLLIYDPNQTNKLDDFSLYYTARVLNVQD